ncbi:MAG: DUF6886 family protein [Planctomycetota bacterium]
MIEPLFHVSDKPAIRCFEPRPSEAVGASVVWAIAADRLHNYLLPRDCPRVTCIATPATDPARLRDLLGGHTALVAIERAWRSRVESAALWLYELPAAPFKLHDPIAGYHIARDSVEPLGVRPITDCPAELAARDARLLPVETLWPLHDEIPRLTHIFSMIRMGNAAPSR